MGLTQPALTRNMKLMEGRLGFEVLIRSRQRILPTSIGQHILKEAASVVQAERRITALTGTLNDERDRQLRIGCSDPALTCLLTNLIMNFSRHYPMTRLDLHCAPAHDMVAMLASGTVEMILGPMEIAEQVQNVGGQALGIVELVIVAARSHPLAAKTTVSIDDLAEQRWALSQSGSYLRSHTDRLLRRLGIAANIRPTELPPEMIMPFLKMGDHLSVLPDKVMLGGAHIADPTTYSTSNEAHDLAILRTGALDAGFTLAALWQGPLPPSREAALFIEMAQAELARIS